LYWVGLSADLLLTRTTSRERSIFGARNAGTMFGTLSTMPCATIENSIAPTMRGVAPGMNDASTSSGRAALVLGLETRATMDPDTFAAACAGAPKRQIRPTGGSGGGIGSRRARPARSSAPYMPHIDRRALAKPGARHTGRTCPGRGSSTAVTGIANDTSDTWQPF